MPTTKADKAPPSLANSVNAAPPPDASAGAGSPHHAVIAEPPLFDEEWTAWVGAVYPECTEAGEQAAAAAYMNALHDVISSGLRRRFLLVVKADVLEWVNENAKTNDLCHEAKATLDAGPRGAEIPDALMTRLLRQYMYKLRAENIEARRLAKEQAAQPPAAEADAGGAGKKKDDKGAKDAKDAPKSAAKKGGKETSASNEPPAPKAKGKLRDRAIPKVKVTPLDDEPVDGPDAYIVLSQFSSPTLLGLILGDTKVPLHCITSLSGIATVPSSSSGFGAAQYQRLLESFPDTDVIYAPLACGGFTDAAAVFEGISKLWFQLLVDKREYAAFYGRQKILSVPTMTAHNGGSDPDHHASSEEGMTIQDLLDHVSPVARVKSSTVKFRLHAAARHVKSRAESVLHHCPPASADHDWRSSHFAKLLGVRREVAHHYLDLVHFEHVLCHDLAAHTWSEPMDQHQLLQSLEDALASTPGAQTAVQSRHSKLLVAVKSHTPAEDALDYAPPKRLGLGEWYARRRAGTLIEPVGYVYDSEVPTRVVAKTALEFPRAAVDAPSRSYQVIHGSDAVYVVAPGSLVVHFQSGSTLELVYRRDASAALAEQQVAEAADSVAAAPPRPAFTVELMYTTATGISCLAVRDGIHFRYPAAGGWRRILGATGDQIVAGARAVTSATAAAKVTYLRADGAVGVRPLAGDSAWEWSTSNDARPDWCTRETDPITQRTMWRRQDGVEAVIQRDKSSSITFTDGTVLQTDPKKGWVTRVPGLGEVEALGAGNLVFRDDMGHHVAFGDELSLRSPTGQIISSTDHKSTISFPGYTLRLDSGYLEPVASPPFTPAPVSLRAGQLVKSLLASPLIPGTAPTCLFTLQHAASPAITSHSRLWTDGEVQRQVLAAQRSTGYRVHLSEEPLLALPTSSSSTPDLAAVAGPVVLNFVTYDLMTRSVVCRQLVRYPPLTDEMRHRVLAAWKELQQLATVPESAAAAPTDDAGGARALLTERDLFLRFLTTWEREQLTSRAAAGTSELRPASSLVATRNAVAPLPMDPSASSLFARPSFSVIRQMLTPVRKAPPPPSQIPVQLAANLRNVRAERGPYFASTEGRRALADLESDEASAAAVPPRHRPDSSPKRPLYASPDAPPIDPDEDVTQGAVGLAVVTNLRGERVLVGSSGSGTLSSAAATMGSSAGLTGGASTNNPFAVEPALPPRANRASTLRTARGIEMAASRQGIVFDAPVVVPPAATSSPSRQPPRVAFSGNVTVGKAPLPALVARGPDAAAILSGSDMRVSNDGATTAREARPQRLDVL
ncbi:hypothetical protein H9P43_000515 [Blastocladiella emersonii ATCC 22665]|nr:hypothetical protein H9P43_000515 [Blastocladiella emersonii ATCC 22665]